MTSSVAKKKSFRHEPYAKEATDLCSRIEIVHDKQDRKNSKSREDNEKYEEEEEEEDYYEARKKLPAGPLRWKFLMNSVIERWEKQGTERSKRLQWKTGCTCAEDKTLCEYCSAGRVIDEDLSAESSEDSFVVPDDCSDEALPSAEVLRLQLEEIDRSGLFPENGALVANEASSQNERSAKQAVANVVEKQTLSDCESPATKKRQSTIIAEMEKVMVDEDELAEPGERCCLHCRKNKLCILLRPCKHLVLCAQCTREQATKQKAAGKHVYNCIKCRAEVCAIEQIFF